MRKTRLSRSGIVAGLVVVLGASLALHAQQSNERVRIDNDDIGGVVTSPNGPEAGVWVIAETTDLPTKLSKTVVTDDRGRYLLPDLPKANYNVWVRGYGLVDSPKVQSAPGKTLNLTATIAPDPHAAAQNNPANYWYSLVKDPDKSEFPGTGPNGNGNSENMKSQAHWLRLMKTDSCWACHQLGNKATREIPKELGAFESSGAGWNRRILSGQAASSMVGGLNQLGLPRALKMFGDWTDRVVAGEIPPAPPRPQGVERNIVITQWDWATDNRTNAGVRAHPRGDDGGGRGIPRRAPLSGVLGGLQHR
jgi:hypothetical protein